MLGAGSSSDRRLGACAAHLMSGITAASSSGRQLPQEPLVVLLLGGPAQFGDVPLTEAVARAVPSGAVEVIDGRLAFGLDDYLAGGWPDVKQVRNAAVAGGLSSQTATAQVGTAAPADREALLASADVVLAGFPYPLDLVARAKKLRWVHSLNAGASNFRQPFAGATVDLWGSDVALTTARGANGSLPIAEYVLASILMWGKSLPQGFADAAQGAFAPRTSYAPQLIAGKTVGVIGLGGIGCQVARLCSAVGMRVVATRRSTLGPNESMPEGVAELLQPKALPSLLAQADFVVVCTQWTPESENLLSTSEFAMMKCGAVLVNVARGEIVDSAALVAALESGHVAAAALDVYAGEFDGLPPEALWKRDNVLITPHVSSSVEVEVASQHAQGMEVFLANLQAFVAGGGATEALKNVVDWQRGY